LTGAVSAPQTPAARNVIRWGIIGCGDVTEVKSGPGFQKAAGSQLVAVMRRNGALAADYARRHGVPRWYDDARALANDPEVDAVYVATPPGAHLEGVRLAVAAGKPVHVEKPMARHTPECDAMIEACATAGVKLFTAYYRRAMPRFLKVRELLDGAIGTLTGVSYRLAWPMQANADPAKGAWRVNATDGGGGLLLDVGSHVLDFLDFCLGPLEDVHGRASRIATEADVEDAVAMTFRTSAGVPGAATWNFSSGVSEDVLAFYGTKGRVAVDFFVATPLRLHTVRGCEEFDIPNPPHVAQPLIQTIVDELLGRGTCPSTGESARRTQAVMDKSLSGYYGGRDDAFWLRSDTWPGRNQLTRTPPD
jgi:1,5-anhydro-D-fructose reductase (1,5-anhydro-D-mannitol-forming)